MAPQAVVETQGGGDLSYCIICIFSARPPCPRNLLPVKAFSDIFPEERKPSVSGGFAFFLKLDPKHGQRDEHERAADSNGSKDPGHGNTSE